MIYLFSRLGIFLLCLISCPVFSQQNLSLSQAIAVGLKNNYLIQIAENNQDIAKNNNSFAEAGRYPTLNFNAGLTNIFTRQNDPRAVNPFNESSFLIDGFHASVDADWVLFDGFKVRINKKRLEELERQSLGNSELMIEKTIQAIILAYYQALSEQAKLNTLNEGKQYSREQIDFMELKKEYGRAIDYDIIQSKDAFLRDSMNALMQNNKYDIALRNLSLVMGLEDLNKRYTLTDALSFIIERYQYAELERRMLISNKDIQLLQMNQSLAKINRDLKESDKSPKVSLGSGLYWGGNRYKIFDNRFDPVTGNNFNFYLDILASYPLYDGGRSKRAVERSIIEQETAMLNTEHVIRTLKVQLRNILETYDSQRQLLKISKALLDNAKANLDQSKERFQSGKINAFEFRSVQLAYIDAAQARTDALLNLRSTETELLSLTGGLVR